MTGVENGLLNMNELWASLRESTIVEMRATDSSYKGHSPTQRAPDVWESARFQAVCVA
jgi:hypothetical protein